MNKKGFTLVEVLITLSIVGIISAITIPSLILNIQKKYWANALATKITQIETSFKNMMIEENAKDLFETEVWENPNNENRKDLLVSKIKCFDNYIDKKFSEYYDKKVYGINREVYPGSAEDILDYIGFNLKNGGIVYLESDFYKFYSLTEEEALQRNISFRTRATHFWIDVNGKNKPNIIGRDLFYFFLGENGKLYARGSKEDALVSNSYDYYWKNKCVDLDNETGFSCTGRLVENNFVMDY